MWLHHIIYYSLTKHLISEDSSCCLSTQSWSLEHQQQVSSTNTVLHQNILNLAFWSTKLQPLSIWGRLRKVRCLVWCSRCAALVVRPHLPLLPRLCVPCTNEQLTQTTWKEDNWEYYQIQYSSNNIFKRHTVSGKSFYLVSISCVYSLFNFWSTLDKLMAPKLEGWVLDELNESNEQAPRVRPVHNETFQQDSCYLLLDSFSVCFSKKVEECATEVVSVAVGITQLVGYCIQEQISTCKTEVKLVPKSS